MTTDLLDREIIVDRDRLDELTLEFNRRHLNKSFQAVAVGGAALGVGGAVLVAGGAYAQGGAAAGGAGGAAAAGAKASIAAGVTNAIDMITAIDGIGLAAFGVALAPMGFMVTLRVLNMVLSRV